jgi:alkanesulfonate monooxygenase SsuD/methylene tetrahydromethanopterin reductase-like flavin-dependent oxidoreductase (luciferase family)
MVCRDIDDQPGGIMNGLQFGVFLSPRAAGIGRLPDNAGTAEEAGFDFISVQDHPYVPAFLDTFALSPECRATLGECVVALPVVA